MGGTVLSISQPMPEEEKIEQGQEVDPPADEEIDNALAYLSDFINRAGADSQNRQKIERLALNTFCQSLLISAEFRYLN